MSHDGSAKRGDTKKWSRMNARTRHTSPTHPSWTTRRLPLTLLLKRTWHTGQPHSLQQRPAGRSDLGIRRNPTPSLARTIFEGSLYLPAHHLPYLMQSGHLLAYPPRRSSVTTERFTTISSPESRTTPSCLGSGSWSTTSWSCRRAA